MLGAPDLGSVITKLDACFDSAQSLSRAQLGDRLGTGDWGFGLALRGAQLGSFGSEPSSAHLGSQNIYKGNNTHTKKMRNKNSQNIKRIDEKPRRKKMVDENPSEEKSPGVKVAHLS